MIGLKDVKDGLAGIGETLRAPETIAEVTRASVRMIPVLALAAAGSVAEDVREGRPLSNGTKVILASCVSNVAISATALSKS